MKHIKFFSPGKINLIYVDLYWQRILNSIYNQMKRLSVEEFKAVCRKGIHCYHRGKNSSWLNWKTTNMDENKETQNSFFQAFLKFSTVDKQGTNYA